MYLDTSYLAKLYLPEPDSALVENLIGGSYPIRTSALAVTEFHSILHRLVNEGGITETHARQVSSIFLGHIADGMWELIPAGEQMLRRTAAIILSSPVGVSIRSADAIHLVSAAEAGEREIWTSDRNMLKAAASFRLVGRTV